MIQFLGRFMKLPVEAFVYSIEMLVQTMRGIRHLAYQGIDLMAEGTVQAPVAATGSTGAQRGYTEATQVTVQEEREMADRDIRDRDWDDRDKRGENVLKLVRYKILFVKRDLEYAFPEKEELVTENYIDETGYIAWKIAEFIQDLRNVEIPRKWRDKRYPRNVDLTSPPEDSPKINELPEDDKKYLRVYYEVLQRYRREPFKYQERQIEVLEQIRDKLSGPMPSNNAAGWGPIPTTGPESIYWGPMPSDDAAGWGPMPT
jgi:hypothetical protein